MNTLDLPFFGVMHVSGADATDFLHRQLSNDILNLGEEHACYATYNSAQGRVIANMLVIPKQTDWYIIMSADVIDSVCQRLKMFVMRSKVSLANVSDAWHIVGELPDTPTSLTLPETPPLRLNVQHNDENTSIRLPHGGILSLMPTHRLPENLGDGTAWHLYEIEHGYPWISLATRETAVAQMLNQHRLGGVHFKKGCYPGQEVIARAQYRGKVKRGLVVIQSQERGQVGQNIVDEKGQEMAQIINSAPQSSGSLNLCVGKFAILQASSIALSSGSPCTIKHHYFPQEDA